MICDTLLEMAQRFGLVLYLDGLEAFFLIFGKLL